MLLPQGYQKTFFLKNLLLMKITPVLDQAVFNFPQNVGKRFNIVYFNTILHLLNIVFHFNLIFSQIITLYTTIPM
jgi:hypothetical protein